MAPTIRKPLYGPDGEVIDVTALKREDGGPTVMGVRQVRSEHPSYGLSPEGLASILRFSETTDPTRFFSLCADIEEREMHYRSVLSTRKGAITQLEIKVEAADVPGGEKHAELIRGIVERPGFRLVLRDMLDALGKGISWTEIVWDVSEGQFMPAKLAWRDPRWFRFDQTDLTTGLLIDEAGIPQLLKPYKWIVHRPKLLSGIPIRNGLTRAAAFGWMFKNFALKDWLIFLEVYGHPLRLGRYPQNATAAEKRVLLRAVAELGSDAAAIVPESMKIEFVEGGGSSAGSGGSVFKEMAVYFDEQASKLVLGQTGTTDAVAGGSRGLGAVQNTVREDIERDDALQSSDVLRIDLVKPAVDLNFGPQKAYPNVRIGRPEQKDVSLIVSSVKELVPLGLRVSQKQMYDVVGIEEPKDGEPLLVAPSKPAANAGGTPAPGARADDPGADDPTPAPNVEPDTVTAAQRRHGSDQDWADRAVDLLIREGGWQPELDGLQAALAKATSIEQAETVLAAHLDKLGLDKLAEILARARFNARGAGVTGE